VVRVILLVVMALLLVRAFARLFGGVAAGARSGQRSRTSTPVKMTRDPVCGTFVVPGKALSLSAGGATHWFCSERCRADLASRS
jgi:YHS domain-containing protein